MALPESPASTFELDADLGPLLGDQLQRLLVLRLRQGFIGRQLQRLAVLLAQPVGPERPAGLVEQPLRRRLVIGQLGRQVDIARAVEAMIEVACG